LNDLTELEITELAPEAAVKLFTDWVGRNQGCLTDRAQEVQQLCERLGCLPLALVLAGSWLSDRERTLTGLITNLEKYGLPSRVLGAADDTETRDVPQKGLMAALEMSWAYVGRKNLGAQQLARVLSLLAAVDLPWDLVGAVVVAYPAASPVMGQPKSEPRRKSWWRRFLDSLVQLVRLFVPAQSQAPETKRLTPPEFAPIPDLTEALRDLVVSRLLQRVVQGEIYRVHPLINDFFGLQWAGADRQGWTTALGVALSRRAKTIPARGAWEEVQALQPLRPHLEKTKQLLEQLSASVTDPALQQIYSTQISALNTGIFWLNQAPVFARTFRRANEQHASGRAALEAGNGAMAQKYFNEAVASYQEAIDQGRQALPESMMLAGYLKAIADLFDDLGKYREGIAAAEEAVKIAEKKASQLRLAGYLNHLAVLYYHQGEYSEAEPLLLRSLEIWEQQLGALHPDVAVSLNNLAELYKEQGKYNEAEPLYLRSLAIYEQQLGAQHPDVAMSLGNLASLYANQGKYSEAEPLYLRSLAIYEQQLGAQHPDVARSLNNLASLYENQGKYSEAEPLYLRSLAIWEQQLGAQHPAVARSLNNLASLYKKQGKYSEAEPLYLRSLAIREQQLGAQHPDVASSLNNLAVLYKEQGKYSEAEPLYLRSLAIREQQLGALHPAVASSLNNLSRIYYETQRNTEALQAIQRAVEIFQQALGIEHPDTQNALGALQIIRNSINFPLDLLLKKNLPPRETFFPLPHQQTSRNPKEFS
jgi:tetratricopeptide (TPR) repeat protein